MLPQMQNVVEGGKSLVSTFQAGVGTFQDGYEQLVHAIIRPPRYIYEEAELGPARFMFAGAVYHRVDFDVSSHRPGRPILKCSHFTPEPKQGMRPLKRPCVVVLHGNAGSRVEGRFLLKTVLSASADLVCFDFAGSGLSQGDVVSLGHFEKDDLLAILERLRCFDHITAIGLWGRSMGAVTALLHAVRDADIAAMVLDSPFTDLRTLAGELAEQETYGAVPSWLADAALSVIKVSIQQRANFDIDDLSPISCAPSTVVPALFATADEDEFIRPHHARRIQEAYSGWSTLLTMDGDHNSERPQTFMDEVKRFFMIYLHKATAAGSGSARGSGAVEYEYKPAMGAATPPPAPAGGSAGSASAGQAATETAFDTSGMYVPIPEPELSPRQSTPSPSSLRQAAHHDRRPPKPKRDMGSPAARTSPLSEESSPGSPPGGGAPLGKQDIRKQLLALGFSAPQVDAAMVRSSTLEGCVEWILTDGASMQ